MTSQLLNLANSNQFLTYIYFLILLVTLEFELEQIATQGILQFWGYSCSPNENSSSAEVHIVNTYLVNYTRVLTGCQTWSYVVLNSP